MVSKKLFQGYSLLLLLAALIISTVAASAQGDTGSISGKVTAAAGGAPLADIDVDAYIFNGSEWEFVDFGFTDAGGNYVINNLAAGTYRLLFHDLENGVYQQEYYDNATSLLSASDIVLTAGGSVNNINAALALPQVPANDLRANATTISQTPFIASQNVQLATTSAADPPPSCGPKDGSVWFKITPSQSLLLTASTLGSEYDTVLAVWWMNGPILTELACNDDVGDDPYSTLELPVIAGQNYFISVSSWDDHTQLLLNVDLLPGNYDAQDINLSAGWSLVSSYVDPYHSDLESVFIGLNPNLILVKNGDGQVYWPALSLNAIGNWDVHDGYQVYMGTPATLVVKGSQVNPAQTPITLLSGWSLVAYLKDTPTHIQQAFSSISSKIRLAKNGSGQVYWPEFGVNQIGNMQPGEGYQVYMNTAGTLTYP